MPSRHAHATPPAPPEERRYDAVELSREVEGGAEAVWKAERRDDAWATERERDLGERLAAELETTKLDAHVQTIECRASSCRVEIDVAADSLDSILGLHPVMMFAPTTLTTAGESSNDPTRATQLFYLAFPPELKRAGDYATYMEGRREWALEMMKGEELAP